MYVVKYVHQHIKKSIIYQHEKLDLKSKINIFNEKTNFKYDIRVIFVTMYGVKENEYYNELVQKQVIFSNIGI